MGIPENSVLDGTTENLLEFLGQFPCNGNGPVSPELQDVLESSDQSLRRFIENERHGKGGVRREESSSPRSSGRGEPEESEGVRRETRLDQGRNQRRGAWDDHEGQFLLDNLLNQHGARIGNGRGPGVRNERNALAGLQPANQFEASILDILAVIADQGLVDVEMGEKLSRVARVFRRNEVYGT